MRYTNQMVHPKPANRLRLLAIACLTVACFSLPTAQAAPQGPLASPNQPTLVSPANGATGVATQPTLSVTVTDPENATMTVRFYGRVKSTPTPDFTLVFIPDTQNESQYNVDMFRAQTIGIVEQKTAMNIVFVTTAGDMVNTSSSTTQYENADSAIDTLDAGGVWYSVAPGNHDIGTGSLYANYFGVSRYANYEVSDGYWFGGSYEDYNTYSLFSASGMDFILVNLQYSPSTAVINWADGLLATYSNRRAIVEQHDILNTNNSWINQTSYTALRDNANLFLMLCGHSWSSTDGAAYVAGTGTDGHTIHVVLADYQGMSNGNGYLRVLRFSPANDMIYMTTNSAYTGGSITTDPDQKDLAYDMTAAPPFELIGTLTEVASGGTASVSWPGRAANTAYEWYVEITDGAPPTTTGPTWSFTTGAPPACFTLTLGHSGDGSTPGATPTKSAACSATGQYVASENIALSGAVPSAGWQISGWTGTSSNSSTASTNSLVMPATAHTAGVTYDRREYALTVNKVGNGTITPDRSAPYYYNDVVQLTATADPDWVFTGWSGACTGSGTCQVTMNADKSVTAHFAQEVSTLGSVDGDGVVNSTDALIILSANAGMNALQFCPMNCGDVNADGFVDSTDALIVLSFNVGMTVPFPVGQPGCPASVTQPPGCNP
jgi:uncharacterized repeat protein (TIGR02543 family)